MISDSQLDRWWDGFRIWLEGQPDPHEAAGRLRMHLRRLPDGERRRFLGQAIEVLIGRLRAYGVTLFLLEDISDPFFLSQIALNLRPMPEAGSDDEESHLADLIRLLGAANRKSLLPAVEDYLLERRIGLHWTSVPWAVWPHYGTLFGRAWCRFFRDHDPEEWKNTTVLDSFLIEPEAVLRIRGLLEPDMPQRWDSLRAALRHQAQAARWLSPRQQSALDQALQ